MKQEYILLGILALIMIGMLLATIVCYKAETPEAVRDRIELDLLKKRAQLEERNAERERMAKVAEQARIQALQTARLNKLSTFTVRHYIMHHPLGTYEDLLKRCEKSTHANYYRGVFEKEKAKAK